MRGKVAKRLRRAIYGENFSPRERQYANVDRRGVKNVGRRAAYQQLKKAVRHGR